MAEKPVLWHIAVSHFSEKARWALDAKGVEYERRAPPPGLHMAFALWLTRGRGKTFPILQLDGETLGDSSEIIGTLERRVPTPPLYPEDPVERRRALDLEDFFDEQVGPYSRLLAFHEAVKDPQVIEGLATDLLPDRLAGSALVRRGSGRFFSAFASLRYGVKNEENADLARHKLLQGFDRLEKELGDDDYLVGGRFTVADLTAASLLYPVVLPPEGPDPGELPAAYQEFRELASHRPGYRWVEETFKKHRRPTPTKVNVPT